MKRLEEERLQALKEEEVVSELRTESNEALQNLDAEWKSLLEQEEHRLVETQKEKQLRQQREEEERQRRERERKERKENQEGQCMRGLCTHDNLVKVSKLEAVWLHFLCGRKSFVLLGTTCILCDFITHSSAHTLSQRCQWRSGLNGWKRRKRRG